MLSLVISCPLLPGFSTKEAPFGCSCRHEKSPNHHQPEHKTYFHFSSHIFVSYYHIGLPCQSHTDVVETSMMLLWRLKISTQYLTLMMVFEVLMLLLSVANVFLDVYFDVDIEMLAEDLWPGQDQIMMFILMSRAGFKLMLMLVQIEVQ